MWHLPWCAWSNKKVLPSRTHAGNVSPGEDYGGLGMFFYLQLKIYLGAISYCRVFLALVDKQEDRGTVVAQGGGKVWHCKNGS